MISDIYNIQYIHYIYGNHKTLISHHGCSYYYYYYIYNCNWSFLHAFVVMCYLTKLKSGMASFFEQISISDLISLTYKTKCIFNRLCANFRKWSNTLKQFVCKLPTNFLNVLDHFVGLALKGLNPYLANWLCHKLDDLI